MARSVCSRRAVAWRRRPASSMAKYISGKPPQSTIFASRSCQRTDVLGRLDIGFVPALERAAIMSQVVGYKIGCFDERDRFSDQCLPRWLAAFGKAGFLDLPHLLADFDEAVIVIGLAAEG